MTIVGSEMVPRSGWRGALDRYREHRRQATHLDFDAFQVSSALLLLALVIHPPGGTHPVARVVLGVGLVLPVVSRRFATFWLVAFVLFLTSPLERAWLTLDNHEVLQVYWLGAFALSWFADHPVDVLRTTARWTLALVFVFATAWKLLAPDFADGSAIEFLFNVEERVGDVAAAVGLQDHDQVAHNRGALAEWHDPSQVPKPVTTDTDETLHRVSAGFAWLTIAAEGVVALAFLLPLPADRRWLRDAALLGFVIVTYPIAPVLPFAWLLLSMGAMQSDMTPKIRNRSYVAAFLVVTFVYGLRSWTLLPLIERLSGAG